MHGVRDAVKIIKYDQITTVKNLNLERHQVGVCVVHISQHVSVNIYAPFTSTELLGTSSNVCLDSMSRL